MRTTTHLRFAPTLRLALLALGACATVQAARAAPPAIVIAPTAPPGAVRLVQYQPPPPPPRARPIPAPRAGKVWVQGHWEWRGNRYIWRDGHWVGMRPGQHYVQPSWVERNGRWHYQGGRWDRDGDGVPNRYDRQPGNPYRH